MMNKTQLTVSPDEGHTVQSQHGPSRRDFLRVSALGLAGGALAACGTGAGGADREVGGELAEGASAAAKANARAAVSPLNTPNDGDHSGGTTAAHPAGMTRNAEEIRASADEMDRHHEHVMKMFRLFGSSGVIRSTGRWRFAPPAT